MIARGENPYKAVSELEWFDDEMLRGKLVKIHGFPRDYKVKLFRVAATNRTEYIATNDSSQNSAVAVKRYVRNPLENRARDRVEVTGLRPLPLPHHRTCGPFDCAQDRLPHPAVGANRVHCPEFRSPSTPLTGRRPVSRLATHGLGFDPYPTGVSHRRQSRNGRRCRSVLFRMTTRFARKSLSRVSAPSALRSTPFQALPRYYGLC